MPRTASGPAWLPAFHGAGYAVVGTARSIDPSKDPDFLAVVGDIAEPATGDRVLTQALDRFGRIDTLVNNAGVFIAKPFTDYTLDDYAMATGVTLAGFFRMTQGAIRQMVGQGAGHIVNITASLVDHADRRSPSALAALTKGGLDAVTRSLATEYASRGVRVNAVAPGVIKTQSTSYKGLPDDRIGAISDVVDAVLYLDSAPFVTGETLHVDGGQAAGH